jgi:hypothetical protein
LHLEFRKQPELTGCAKGLTTMKHPFSHALRRNPITRTLLIPGLVAVSMLTLIPGAIKAQTPQSCLPQAPAGWQVPFTMTTHTSQGNNHDLVSYTRGILTSYGNYYMSGWKSDHNTQLFSNQFAGSAQDGFNQQPFAIDKPNYIGLNIFVNHTAWPATIGVTLTLDSWGYGTSSFEGHCDAGSNLLYGTVDNSAMVLISFDQPYGPGHGTTK